MNKQSNLKWEWVQPPPPPPPPSAALRGMVLQVAGVAMVTVSPKMSDFGRGRDIVGWIFHFEPALQNLELANLIELAEAVKAGVPLLQALAHDHNNNLQ